MTRGVQRLRDGRTAAHYVWYGFFLDALQYCKVELELRLHQTTRNVLPNCPNSHCAVGIVS